MFTDHAAYHVIATFAKHISANVSAIMNFFASARGGVDAESTTEHAGREPFEKASVIPRSVGTEFVMLTVMHIRSIVDQLVTFFGANQIYRARLTVVAHHRRFEICMHIVCEPPIASR
jgi:hypothetical protein